MPEYGRILAPVSDGLLAHLIREPLIREHLFDLSESREAGFELPSSGLLVVRLPDDWWANDSDIRELGPGVLEVGGARDRAKSRWLHLSCDAHPALMDDVELRERF